MGLEDFLRNEVNSASGRIKENLRGRTDDEIRRSLNSPNLKPAAREMVREEARRRGLI